MTQLINIPLQFTFIMQSLIYEHCNSTLYYTIIYDILTKCIWKWNYKTHIIYGKSILDQIDMEIINMEFPSHLRKVESIVREFRCCSSYELIFN